MKHILLINQHSSNRGDEAAALAFSQYIRQKKHRFSIIYNATNDKAKLDLKLDFAKTILTTKISLFQKLLIFASFFFPVQLMALFFYGNIQEEFLAIKRATHIVNMPGGANLGLYQDWRYLWRLYIALKLSKNVAIYSTSIGPFKNNLFYFFSKNVLSQVNFLSLRDSESFRIADKMGVKYIKSIDTAFLRLPVNDNFSFTKKIPNNKFIVVIPNQLAGEHITFIDYSKDKLSNLFVDIIDLCYQEGYQVVMLPQLFANGDDTTYFRQLARKSKNSDNITIVNSNYNSDIQQLIISQADCVIGARYHSIVFAINNNKPFISLSYENKMKYMLEALLMEDGCFDLTELTQGVPIEDFFSKVREFILSKVFLGQTVNRNQANKIATICYKTFSDEFLEKMLSNGS